MNEITQTVRERLDYGEDIDSLYKTLYRLIPKFQR